MKRIGDLNSSLNIKLLENIDMGYYILLLESQGSSLASTGSNNEKQMKIGIVISSLSQNTKYAAVITAINTLNEEGATCNYV